ncbi:MULTISPECIES: hypothetical protein [Streptomyces]|uniref:hypothetical protein n=1 Tax=Streptomyces TaxID=1883 RepID=UPI002249611B|nr:hypothetical protein [Streptomyces sp. JHD 1]MCX2968050.1 hypothetical protein [Streptomyces sp. JHD 1]
MFRIRTAVAALAIAGIGVVGSAGTASACAKHIGDKYGDKVDVNAEFEWEYEENHILKQEGNCNTVVTQVGGLNANFGGPVCISFD